MITRRLGWVALNRKSFSPVTQWVEIVKQTNCKMSDQTQSKQRRSLFIHLSIYWSAYTICTSIYISLPIYQSNLSIRIDKRSISISRGENFVIRRYLLSLIIRNFLLLNILLSIMLLFLNLVFVVYFVTAVTLFVIAFFGLVHVVINVDITTYVATFWSGCCFFVSWLIVLDVVIALFLLLLL